MTIPKTTIITQKTGLFTIEPMLFARFSVGIFVSFGLTDGSGVYFVRVTTMGVELTDGLAVTFGLGVGDGLGVALHSQDLSDWQEGLRQNP